MKNAALLYDMVRIDHFRGFHTYWSIPAGAEHALEGHWEPGPGQALLNYLACDADKLEKLLADPRLLKTPIVRNGRQATVGYRPEVWKNWE